jgi:hypothetical protein
MMRDSADKKMARPDLGHSDKKGERVGLSASHEDEVDTGPSEQKMVGPFMLNRNTEREGGR